MPEVVAWFHCPPVSWLCLHWHVMACTCMLHICGCLKVATDLIHFMFVASLPWFCITCSLLLCYMHPLCLICWCLLQSLFLVFILVVTWNCWVVAHLWSLVCTSGLLCLHVVHVVVDTGLHTCVWYCWSTISLSCCTSCCIHPCYTLWWFIGEYVGLWHSCCNWFTVLFILD